MTELSFLAAFSLGFLGSAHCLGMCGGVSNALGIAGDGGLPIKILSYNAGRILSYGLLGGLMGFVGESFVNWLPGATLLLRTLAGLLLIAMGLYLSQWWMGLTRLEKIGGLLWQRIQPLASSYIPVKTPLQALRLGMLWGFLPCGLVYSTLALALFAAAPLQSALLMLAFGFGTLPAMLFSGLMGQKILVSLRKKNYRVLASLAIIAMGLLTLLVPWWHLVEGHNHTDTDKHQHHHAGDDLPVVPNPQASIVNLTVGIYLSGILNNNDIINEEQTS